MMDPDFLKLFCRIAIFDMAEIGVKPKQWSCSFPQKLFHKILVLKIIDQKIIDQ